MQITQQQQLLYTVKKEPKMAPKVADFFFKVMVFYCVFDGVRSFMVVGADQLTFGKEISVSVLTFMLFLKRPSGLFKRLLYSNMLFSIYLIFAGTLMIVLNGYARSTLGGEFDVVGYPTAFATHFKNIEGGFAILSLFCYEHLTNKPIKNLLKYFVKLCFIYVVLTLLCYTFLDLSFIFEKHWPDRISIGYPTLDAQVLCFGLAYVIFSKNAFSKLWKAIYIPFLIIGTVISATETGLLSIFVVLMMYVIYYIITNPVAKVLSVKNIAAIVVIVGGITLFNSAKVPIPGDFEIYLNLFENKFESASNKITGKFSNQNTDIDDRSAQTRQREVIKAFSVNDDSASLILGGPIELAMFIENENYFLLRAYGIIGFTLYYVWALAILLFALKKIKQNARYLLLVGLALIIMSSLSLITTYVFGLPVCIGMFIANAFADNNKSNNSLSQIR